MCTKGRRARLESARPGPAGAVQRTKKPAPARGGGCVQGPDGGPTMERGRGPGPWPGPSRGLDRVASVLGVGRSGGLGISPSRAARVAVQGPSDTGEGAAPAQLSKLGSGRKPTRVGSGPDSACDLRGAPGGKADRRAGAERRREEPRSRSRMGRSPSWCSVQFKSSFLLSKHDQRCQARHRGDAGETRFLIAILGYKTLCLEKLSA